MSELNVLFSLTFPSYYLIDKSMPSTRIFGERTAKDFSYITHFCNNPEKNVFVEVYDKSYSFRIASRNDAVGICLDELDKLWAWLKNNSV